MDTYLLLVISGVAIFITLRTNLSFALIPPCTRNKSLCIVTITFVYNYAKCLGTLLTVHVPNVANKSPPLQVRYEMGEHSHDGNL